MPGDETKRLLDAYGIAAFRDGDEKTQVKLEMRVAARLALNAHLTKMEGRITAVCKLLAENGCDCDCGHNPDEHGDECELCLACRIDRALRGEP